VINLDLPWNPAVLEQRIGRVHRIGQHRPVRVVNFVSEGSIEHGMLRVLAFKKSAFAGVLDGGEDRVFLGDTQLRRFMKTVEEVTRQTPETAQEPPPETAVEEETGSSAEATPESSPEPASPVQPLLRAGAAFLKEPAGLAAEAKRPGSQAATALVERDEKTGRSYLKIPMPEPKVVQDVLGALKPFLEKFGKQ
jgi:hypothetical protein